MCKKIVVLPTLSKYAAKVQTNMQGSMCGDVVETVQTDIPSEHLGGPLYTRVPESFFEGYVSSKNKKNGTAMIVPTDAGHSTPVIFHKKNYQNQFRYLRVKQAVVYCLVETPQGLVGVEVGMLKKI